jgi:hypothetical protein
MGLGDWLKSLVALNVGEATARAGQAQAWPVQGQPPAGGPANYGGQGYAPQGFGNQGGPAGFGGQPVVPQPFGGGGFGMPAPAQPAPAVSSAASWQDDWGPCQPNALETFFVHQFEVDEAKNDPAKRAGLLRKFGYQDEAHYSRVHQTFLKHFGSGSPTDPLTDWTFDFSQARVIEAISGAKMKQMQMRMDDQAQANPQLLAPIEGVTIEEYAALSVEASSINQQNYAQEWAAVLARHNMDHAKYSRVQAGWNDRMAKDTTFVVNTAYGRAFNAQGAGQYGAAGAAGAAAMQATGQSGVLARPGGAEPVSFERYCEIQGAQTAWSKTGRDVNAMLRQVFQMNAMDWSNMSSYWMTKMMADMNMMNRYTQLTAQYEQKYSGPNPDADLSF